MPPANSAYKSIDTLLGAMIAQLQANGSQITDFHTGGVARTVFEALAICLSQGTLAADQMQLDSHLDTATGAALDALGTNFFVPRIPAVQAQGSLTITRQDTSQALLLAADWSQLVTVPSLPGQSGVAVVTTQDASFAIGQATAVVPAQAVLGGLAGNLAAGTLLTPLAPVSGISDQTGYQVTTAFTNGVDAESDDAYRARIPIDVQGRVPGKMVSFLAAALRVAGVIGAKVLQAGDQRGDSTTVPAGSVEIYYRGDSGLQPAVQSSCASAAVLNQNPTVLACNKLGTIVFLPATFPASGGLVMSDQLRGVARSIVGVNVYVNAGTDPSTVQGAVSTAILNYFATLNVGQTASYAAVINTITRVQGVVDIDVPLVDFRLWTAAPGTTGNIVPLPDTYLNLVASDLTVTIHTLTS